MERLNSSGGHIVVALLIFFTGVGLVLRGVDLGKEVTMGALASLWTALRIGGGDGPRATKTAQ